MARFDYNTLRTLVHNGVKKEGLRPFSRRLDLPVGVIRSLQDGRDVSVANLKSLSEKLGMELYLGPRRNTVQELKNLYPAVFYMADKAKALEKALEGLDLPRFEDDFAIIPRLDAQLSAGEGIFNEDDQPIDFMAFTRDWMDQHSLSDKTTILVTIRGDSMLPTLCCGDLVLIDKNRKAIRNGKVYAFNDVDGGSKVKRLEVMPEVAIIIRSDNPEHEAIYRKDADMNALADGIIGEVVWSGHTWK